MEAQLSAPQAAAGAAFTFTHDDASVSLTRVPGQGAGGELIQLAVNEARYALSAAEAEALGLRLRHEAAILRRNAQAGGQ